jgi:hypothetical protein
MRNEKRRKEKMRRENIFVAPKYSGAVSTIGGYSQELHAIMGGQGSKAARCGWYVVVDVLFCTGV